MAQEFDAVAAYGQSVGWELRPRTVLVEGTRDAALFKLAARLELERSGVDVLRDGLAIIAAGEGDQGGTRGIVRELIALRCFARTCLMPNGRPRYRFIGLFDNDTAGRQGIQGARSIDMSILEYKDVFRLMPVMPTHGNLDQRTLRISFDRLNMAYKGLDWEVEDLLPLNFVSAFLTDCPNAMRNTVSKGDKVHWEFTSDGKARLHKYVHKNAIWEDLVAVLEVIDALRFYLCLPRLGPSHD